MKESSIVSGNIHNFEDKKRLVSCLKVNRDYQLIEHKDLKDWEFVYYMGVLYLGHVAFKSAEKYK